MLIHAASGGVGSAAVQLAHAIGAVIVATAEAAKLDRVRSLGADWGVDYHTGDFAKAVGTATGGKGVDVVIDFIGAPYLERNIRALAPGRRRVQVGIMGGGANATLPLDLVLFRHLRIMGTVMKSRPPAVKQAMVRRFSDRWLSAFERHEIAPVIGGVFPLAQAAEAHRRMEQGGSFGKIILAMAKGQQRWPGVPPPGAWPRHRPQGRSAVAERCRPPFRSRRCELTFAQPEPSARAPCTGYGDAWVGGPGRVEPGGGWSHPGGASHLRRGNRTLVC